MRTVTISRRYPDRQTPDAFLDEVKRCYACYGGHWAKARILEREVGGKRLFFVDDTGQAIGAFKVRGAWTALAELMRREPEVRRVLAASSGSFGMSVALAARHLGVSADICMPRSAPDSKKRKIEGLGARVLDSEESYEASKALARRLAGEDPESRFVNGVGPDVYKGNATLALEMEADGRMARNRVAVVAPLGIGSLAVPLSLALRALGHEIGVFLAEPVRYCKLYSEYRETVPEYGFTLADGAAVRELPDVSHDQVHTQGDVVCALEEDEIAEAMRWLGETLGVTAEGAGALATAVWLRGPELFRDYDQVWMMITGGNVQHGASDEAPAGA